MLPHIEKYLRRKDETIDIVIPQQFNIAAAIIDVALLVEQQRMAFTVENESEIVKTLSYRELVTQTNQLCRFLLQLNLKSHDRIIIKLENCIEYPVMVLAIILANYIAVPMSTMLSVRETDFIIRDATAKVIVTTTNFLPTIDANDCTILLLDKTVEPENKNIYADVFSQLDNFSSTKIEPNSSPEDPAYLVYTSGTTGNPKGVLHAQRSTLGRLPAAVHWFKTADEQTILHTGQFNWTYVLGTALLDPLLQGHSVIAYQGKGNAHKWLELIARYRCTTFIAVPTIYRQILHRTDASKLDVPSLNHCMSAGEKISEQILKQFQARFQLLIHEGLGMSEISYYISQSASFSHRVGAIGKIQIGHKVLLVDNDLKEVDINKEGMLAIEKNDAGLFLQYWNNPEEQSKMYKENLFLTGDYAIKDKEGYIYFLGRRDDIINSFGYRISPFEIEKVLKDHALIFDAVAISLDVGGDKTIIVAAIILSEKQSLSVKVINEYLKDRLAQYKCPRNYVFLKKFPRTSNGKVIRNELRNIIRKELNEENEHN